MNSNQENGKRHFENKDLIARSIFIACLFLITCANNLFAQAPPPVGCAIAGTNPVTQGNSYTYHLTGACSATSWSVSCGTVQSSDATTATILFNGTGCFTATITAFNGATMLATKVITINPAPLTGGSIISPNQTINYNTAPAQLTCTSPTGGSCGSYSYQWYSSPNASTWTSISGATSASYQPPALTSTTYYERNTICGSSNAYTSNYATITVLPQLVAGNVYLTGHSGVTSETINYLAGTGLMTLSGVSGGNGAYTYQWQSSPDNLHWTPIPSATGTTYSAASLFSTTYYNVAVTSYGVVLNSSSYEVIVNPQVVAGAITPSYMAIFSGTNSGQINGSVASGGSCGGSFTYQWQSSSDGITFSSISGQTSLNYSPGAVSSNTWFRRRVICGTDTEYTNTAQFTIANTGTVLNFIRSRIILKAGVTDTVTAEGLSSASDVSQTTQYFDGLGRAVQTVSRQSSPLQKDMVETVVYDNFGRQPVQYMPYAASTSDGNYKSSALTDEQAFNAAMFPAENYYLSEVNYEASPANRPLNSYAPGASWIGGVKGSSAQYLLNTTSDSVRIWSISSTQLSIPVSSSAYGAGQLLKYVTTDEQGHIQVRYKDKMGKTILEKVQQSLSPSTGHYGWLCTYYVYDTLQNLRVIIQPQAVALINGSWTISSNIANELCFQYEYDGRRRLAIKKVPGAGQVWMVYDARDRMAMVQDSLLRAQQKWMFTKYDSQNRPDSTGTITDAAHYNNLAYHDSLAYYSTNYPTVGSFTNELLTMNFYDDYSWVATYSAGVGSSMATTYTSNSSYFITSYNSSPTYAVAITPSYIVHGMPTGSMKKVIGSSSQYLYTSDFYDDRARPIQSQSINYTGGIDTVTMQYNFSGAVLRTMLNHKKNGNTTQAHIVLTKMDYDHRFRLRHIYKNIDNATSDQLIDSLQYNELGQLHAKYLGNKVDSMIYDYNIRGWLTGINKNYVAGSANHFFGMELGYDKTSSAAPGNTYITPELNGNIEGIVWKSAGSGINRKYDYTYDPANRLTGAGFLQNTTGTSWDKNYIDFSVTGLSYDANGNILTMTQRGFTVGGSSAVDSLTYTYLNSGASNKLMGVTDAANNPTSLLGDFHYATGSKQSTDYNYNGNGNITHDNNKAIDTISYNYLSLPQTVHMNTRGNITYTYDAAGIKLKKVITDSTNRHSTTILYVAGFVYQQTDTITNPGGGTDTLQFLMHEEGRTRWAYHKYINGTSAYKFEYDFFEKDHLGNTRMVLTQQRDTTNYLASLEAAYRSTEVQLFGNITQTAYPWASVPGSGGLNLHTITNPNDTVSKVDYNGTTGQKTGPNLLLKVMSGDTITLGVQAFYNTGSGSTNNSSFTDVLTSLANGLVNTTGGSHGNLTNLTQPSSTVYTGLTSFLGSDDTVKTGYPKAYLNWIFLDDQFNYVSSLSGAVPAASSTYPAGTLNTVAPGSPININRSGYLYIWVSNETQNWDVFFDNLSVQYKQGPVLEENHYYPFGLTMAGISDKAVKTNYAENKYRYNQGAELQNKEFSDGSGLELYETSYRSYDPQLGRFAQVDPLADRFSLVSTYQYGMDNPVSFNDPTGAYAARAAGLINMSYGPNSDFGDDGAPNDRSVGGGLGGGGGFGGGGNGMYIGNGMYQLPDGQTGDINDALNYVSETYGDLGNTLYDDDAQRKFLSMQVEANGGQMTSSMAASLVQLTFGAEVSNVSATDAVNGFDVTMTATSDGNKENDIYYNGSEINNMFNNLIGDDENSTWGLVESDIFKGSKTIDDTWTLSQTPGYFSETYKAAALNAGKTSAMKLLGRATGAISLVNDVENIVKDYKKGNGLGVAWNVTKGVATIAFWALGGEELELGWNLLTMAGDYLMDDDN